VPLGRKLDTFYPELSVYLARKIVHAIAVPLLLASAAQASQAQNINFDERAPYLTGTGLGIENGYMGLNWGTGNNRIGMMTQGNENFRDIVCRSGRNCAHNINGNPGILSSSTPMTLSGHIRVWNLFLTGGGGAVGVQMISKDAAGAQVGAISFLLDATLVQFEAGYQPFSFMVPFTSVEFSSFGNANGSFLIDDLVVSRTVTPPAGPGQSVVPEPSTYLLMAAGLVGIAAISRRRRALQS